MQYNSSLSTKNLSFSTIELDYKKFTDFAVECNVTIWTYQGIGLNSSKMEEPALVRILLFEATFF